MIGKVISGGQTGVDQSALRAAVALGIPTGGFAPKGWLTEDGPAPWLADFGLVECDSPGYPARTRANVAAADWTLWFGDTGSAGGRVTLNACCSQVKPCVVVAPLDESNPQFIANLFRAFPLGGVLNVAGNRESKCPGIGARAEAFLRELFALLLNPGKASEGGGAS